MSIETQIAECHQADVANGLTGTEAYESDAFARRVMGYPDPEEANEDHAGPVFVRGRCTRCKRPPDYCEC